MIKRWNRFFTLLAALIGFFLLTGCVTTAANSGRLKFDRELDDAFARYEVLPDHNYYTASGYPGPAAILAIHKDYRLENSENLWVPVPGVDSAQIQSWLEDMAPDVSLRSSVEYAASYVLDPEGKRVGAWYSAQRITTVKFLEGNIIKVYTPHPEPFRREMRKGGRR